MIAAILASLLTQDQPTTCPDRIPSQWAFVGSLLRCPDQTDRFLRSDAAWCVSARSTWGTVLGIWHGIFCIITFNKNFCESYLCVVKCEQISLLASREEKFIRQTPTWNKFYCIQVNVSGCRNHDDSLYHTASTVIHLYAPDTTSGGTHFFLCSLWVFPHTWNETVDRPRPSSLTNVGTIICWRTARQRQLKKWLANIRQRLVYLRKNKMKLNVNTTNFACSNIFIKRSKRVCVFFNAGGNKQYETKSWTGKANIEDSWGISSRRSVLRASSCYLTKVTNTTKPRAWWILTFLTCCIHLETKSMMNIN